MSKDTLDFTKEQKELLTEGPFILNAVKRVNKAQRSVITVYTYMYDDPISGHYLAIDGIVPFYDGHYDHECLYKQLLGFRSRCLNV